MLISFGETSSARRGRYGRQGGNGHVDGTLSDWIQRMVFWRSWVVGVGGKNTMGFHKVHGKKKEYSWKKKYMDPKLFNILHELLTALLPFCK